MTFTPSDNMSDDGEEAESRRIFTMIKLEGMSENQTRRVLVSYFQPIMKPAHFMPICISNNSDQLSGYVCVL